MARGKRRHIPLLPRYQEGGDKLTDIAERVLEQFADHQFLTQQRIVQLASHNELLSNPTKTPSNTLLPQINLEIDRDQKRGVIPRFTTLDQEGTRVVGLSSWNPDSRSIKDKLKQHNEAEYRKIINYIRSLPPEKFENLIGLLFSHLGFDPIEVTGKTNDHGVDVRGTLSISSIIHIEMAIQVKRWEKNVGSPVIRELHGSLRPQERGLVVTTSDFTPAAHKAAVVPDRAPIELVNGQQLVTLIVEHEILSQRTRYDWIDFKRPDELTH